MPQQDTKQSEKAYLRRSAGGEWEASKPFPPPGQIATDDHAQHMLDFAVLLRVLTPGPSDLVLDLGAGSCWISDWLRRCGVRTVALDISLDMLRLGATRLGGARGLTAGDMEHLPFADHAFSKACCLNAFHHVPDTVACASRNQARARARWRGVFLGARCRARQSSDLSGGVTQLRRARKRNPDRRLHGVVPGGRLCGCAAAPDYPRHPAVRAQEGSVAGLAHLYREHAPIPGRRKDAAGGIGAGRASARRACCSRRRLRFGCCGNFSP